MRDLWSAALQSQSEGCRELPLSRLWEELAAGRLNVAGHFNAEGRCYAVLEQRQRTGVPSSRRSLEILRRVLLGEPQKVIALELAMSPSNVAVSAAQCARALGLNCRVARIPAVVLMATQAKELGHAVPSLWSSLVWNEVPYSVVSAQRPLISALDIRLSSAERHIAELLVERLSNAEIAEIRRTSARTVANQLASMQQKLRVRGRGAVLSRLFAFGAVARPGGGPLAVPQCGAV